MDVGHKIIDIFRFEFWLQKIIKSLNEKRSFFRISLEYFFLQLNSRLSILINSYTDYGYEHEKY